MTEQPQQPQPEQQPQPPRTVGRWSTDQVLWLVAAVVVGMIVVAVVAAGAFMAGRATGRFDGRPHPHPRVSTHAMVRAASAPGVVDINTVLGNQHAAAAGTGIVLSADGMVLTNDHVVTGATSISVTDVDNGQSYQATVVGYDRSADLAVVKLADATGLTVAPLGHSSGVNPGDPVQAIGNAGGTGGAPSVVTGTVTALDQQITAQNDASGATEQLSGLIETNAAIRPGDSGGPLTSASGQVIGIDTAGTDPRSPAPGGERDAFAIPIDTALRTAGQIEGGQASKTVHIGQTAFLGVQLDGCSFRCGRASGGGAAVLGVMSGSPADQAGLAAGDVMRTVDGQGLDSPNELSTALDQHHPGDRLTIGWTDASGQPHTATVTAAAGPAG